MSFDKVFDLTAGVHSHFYNIYIFITHIYFPASGQVVDTGVVPSAPRFLPSIFIAHRVQQSYCLSIFYRVLLLTHALALSASQSVCKKKSPRKYTSMHSGGFELTKLTCVRLKDNLIRHRGDRLEYIHSWYMNTINDIQLYRLDGTTALRQQLLFLLLLLLLVQPDAADSRASERTPPQTAALLDTLPCLHVEDTLTYCCYCCCCCRC